MSSNHSSSPKLPNLPLGPSPKRETRQAAVAWKSNIITVGGDAPVRVQSMTNTDTADAVGTAIQIKNGAAGFEMVPALRSIHQSCTQCLHSGELDRWMSCAIDWRFLPRHTY